MSLKLAVKQAVLYQEFDFFQERCKELEAREKLSILEEFSRLEEQVECPLNHTFAPGLYAREISVPKDTVVVTKLHKQDHFTFVLKGECSVYQNGEIKRIKAPCMFLTKAGTKRAVYVHEDTIWTTVHHNPNNETDLEKIEDFVIAKNYKELEGEILCLG